MAMHRPDRFVGIGDALAQGFNQSAKLLRQRVADGIRHIDRGRARLDDLLDDAAQKINVRTPGVFRRKLDVIGVLACPTYCTHGLIDHLRRLHAQLFFHVDGRGGDEGMQARRTRDAHGLTATAHILFIGARQAADRAVFDRAGYGLHRLEIAIAGGGKTRFDNIHVHALQLARDADFFFLGHGSAGALFAVAHSGVEYDEFLFGHDFLRHCFQSPRCFVRFARSTPRRE